MQPPPPPLPRRRPGGHGHGARGPRPDAAHAGAAVGDHRDGHGGTGRVARRGAARWRPTASLLCRGAGQSARPPGRPHPARRRAAQPGRRRAECADPDLRRVRGQRHLDPARRCPRRRPRRRGRAARRSRWSRRRRRPRTTSIAPGRPAPRRPGTPGEPDAAGAAQRRAARRGRRFSDPGVVIGEQRLLRGAAGRRRSTACR